MNDDQACLPKISAQAFSGLKLADVGAELVGGDGRLIMNKRAASPDTAIASESRERRHRR